MKISATVDIDVPKSFYCNRQGGKLCPRVKRSEPTKYNKGGETYCLLFGDWLVESEGKVVKCRDCVRAVLKELEKR